MPTYSSGLLMSKKAKSVLRLDDYYQTYGELRWFAKSTAKRSPLTWTRLNCPLNIAMPDILT